MFIMNFIDLIGLSALSVILAIIFMTIIYYKLPGGMKGLIGKLKNPLGAVVFVALNIILILFVSEEYINIIKLESMATKDFLILLNLSYLVSLFIMRIFKPARKIESVKTIRDFFYVGVLMVFVLSASSIIIMDLLIAFTWLVKNVFSILLGI